MYAEGLPVDARLKALTRDGGCRSSSKPRALRLTSPTASTLTREHAGSSTSRSPRPWPARSGAARNDLEESTWRGKFRSLPELDTVPFDRRRSRRSMASRRALRSSTSTGRWCDDHRCGKTYTAVTSSYRMLKWGGFNRILFLVDRNNLAEQTMAEFQKLLHPDDGRRFTELYNVAKLNRGGMPDDPVRLEERRGLRGRRPGHRRLRPRPAGRGFRLRHRGRDR